MVTSKQYALNIISIIDDGDTYECIINNSEDGNDYEYKFLVLIKTIPTYVLKGEIGLP